MFAYFSDSKAEKKIFFPYYKNKKKNIFQINFKNIIICNAMQ